MHLERHTMTLQRKTSPVIEPRWSVVQPLHFVSDSRASLSITQPSWFPTQIRQRGCPPASCCHSFSRPFRDDNNNRFVSEKQDVQETKKQVVWFYCYLSMGRWWGSSVQIWCSSNPQTLDPMTFSVLGSHNNNNSSSMDSIHETISSHSLTHQAWTPFNIHVSRKSISVILRTQVDQAFSSCVCARVSPECWEHNTAIQHNH